VPEDNWTAPTGFNPQRAAGELPQRITLRLRIASSYNVVGRPMMNASVIRIVLQDMGVEPEKHHA